MEEQKTNSNALLIILAVIVLIVVAVFAFGNDKDMDNTDKDIMDDQDMAEEMQGVEVGGALMVPNKDIVANAMNADNVTTLVAAVGAAGLVETLQGPGPFTVFAPNNDAFDKLPDGTVETLLKPENKEKLAAILTYHVVSGRYTMADLSDGQVLTSVQGEELMIGKEDGELTINNVAMVETADVISSNGVTFVIDTVLTIPNQE